MKKLVIAVVLGVVSVGSAYAASVKNNDTNAQTLVVTEGSSKTQLQVGAGETVEFCSGGCFVTFPNGDREALTGNETVEITGGKISIK